MKRSNSILLLCCAWSFVRLAMILFFIGSSNFPWNEVRTNLLLVWFATPGIAGGILAFNMIWSGRQTAEAMRPLMLLMAVDILMGIAVSILGAISILGVNFGINDMEGYASLSNTLWNIVLPVGITFINGLFLWILYNKFLRKKSEE